MPHDNASTPTGHTPADKHRGPIGVGSEATEGIHGVDMKGAHTRTALEHRTPQMQPGVEPLRERAWVHESGYGGKSGKPRTSSDAREAEEQHPSTPTPVAILPPTGKAR